MHGWPGGMPASWASQFGHVDNNTIADHSFAAMWARGWEAGCRQMPRDHHAKGRFIALSLGREVVAE